MLPEYISVIFPEEQPGITLKHLPGEADTVDYLARDATSLLYQTEVRHAEPYQGTLLVQTLIIGARSEGEL